MIPKHRFLPVYRSKSTAFFPRRSGFSLRTGSAQSIFSSFCPLSAAKASAESLTHAAVYEALPEVGAVVHVHSLWLWEKLLNNYPTTSVKIEYGTPEMALAVQSLAAERGQKEEKIIIMGGHREGILAFGKNLEEATTQIINIYNRYQND